MQVPEFDWSKPQRPSHIALVFIVGKILRESWLVILFLVGRKFLRNEEKQGTDRPGVGYYLLGMLAVLLMVRIHYIIQHFRFRFYIEAGELIILSGVLTRKKTSIPLNRIQSVHLTQSYLHRLTNTCGLKLETAGSDETELKIDAIRRERALELQAILQQKEEASADSVVAHPPALIGIRPVDLLKLALSENHIKTLLLILTFILARIDDMQHFVDVGLEDVEQQVDQVRLTTRLILSMIGFGLVLTLIVSFVRTVLRYQDWQLRLTEKGFQLNWGFFQTQQKMVLQRNVQLISWESNFLRGLLGIRTLRLFTAGENILQDAHWIRVPVLQQSVLQELTRAYQPVWPSATRPPLMVHGSYAWRSTVLVILPITVISCTAVYFWKPWLVIVPILFLAYFSVSNLIRQRRFRFWYDEQTLQIRKGIWGTNELLLRFENVQQVEVKTSPFLRSRKLATLVFHASGDVVSIPYIPVEQAQFIADLCLSKQG